jgi:hypothetical protein
VSTKRGAQLLVDVLHGLLGGTVEGVEMVDRGVRLEFDDGTMVFVEVGASTARITSVYLPPQRKWVMAGEESVPAWLSEQMLKPGKRKARRKKR